MKERFVIKDFRRSSKKIIQIADQIIHEYQEMGFQLTLRQLYYQFVARDILPNKQTEYKRLGSIINDARLAGLLDWDAIEDRTRNVRSTPTWENPADIITGCANGYAIDLWERQDWRPEVWIEKDALVGVIESVCRRWQVPFFACRGYTSQSEQYRAGKRFAYNDYRGFRSIVFHLGDHDPSGIDMTRDNQERLDLFSDHAVTVKRLALNFDQIEEYDPPPNPAKESDSRSEGYIRRFGDSSWELDALDPRVIDKLISDEIEAIVNHEVWQEDRALQDEQRNLLQASADNWNDVERFVRMVKNKDDVLRKLTGGRYPL